MIHTSNWIWKLMEKFVFPCLLKISTKLQQKSMFYGSVIKQQIKYVIFNIRIYSFSTKYLHIYFYSKNVCQQMSAIFPKLPLLVVPKSPSTWTTKQNSTKIQNSNPQLSNGLFPSVMPCKPQKLCNLPTLLTSSPWGCMWYNLSIVSLQQKVSLYAKWFH
jgi:hypothetical protein